MSKKELSESRKRVNFGFPQLEPEPMLVAVRSFAHSPFKEEEGHILYLGDFDCNWIPVHNKGWIYRAEY
ncbi:hypothetical protein KAX97_14540 [candidate division WOR-3 bacterium]|nr:hypothetical protein [candidate division WOR-3 bacterium]